MKKLLLLFTLFTAALGSASADEAAYVADGASLTSPKLQSTISNDTSGDIIDSEFSIAGVCSMKIEKKTIPPAKSAQVL